MLMRAAVFLLTLFCLAGLVGCGASDKPSFLDEIEFGLPGIGKDVYLSGDNERLEVPPDLAPLNDEELMDVPSDRNISMSDMAFDSYVLPERLDLRIHREGDVSWLAVDVDPVSLWPELQNFLRVAGFAISERIPIYGYIETEWRERKLDITQKRSGVMRVRTRLSIHLEREPNAVTNVFISVREAAYVRGGWQTLPPDASFERRLLLQFKDYLAADRELANPKMASLQDIQIPIQIRDAKGVAVLEVGQVFSKVWRRVASALARSGIALRGRDRSRGIYLIAYRDRAMGRDAAIDDVVGTQALLQIHLLEAGEYTLVTVHSNKDGKQISYALAQRVLQHILMAYRPALAS